MDSLHEIERNLLGSILIDNKHLDEAEQALTAEDFGLDTHRVIYRRIVDLRGGPFDMRLLALELEKHGELSAVRGYAYLAELADGLPRRPSISGWVKAISDASRARRIRTLLEEAGHEIDTGGDADSVRDRCISRLLELQSPMDEAAPGAAIIPLLDRMQREHTRKGELLGLPTGLASLDKMTRGMQASELIVLGARSGVGKSAFMVQAAIANCRVGNPVLIFSLEMTQEQVYRRILASVAGVPFSKVRDPKWATDADMSKIQYAASQVTEWPLEIDPNGAIHIDQLTSKARHAIRRRGVKLICIDYAQIVPADGRDERLRVATVSRGITRLAKEEGVAVILLSQLSRPDKTNANRRPRLSDLRETSQLENDANVAVLLHRPVDDDDQPCSEAELILAKQRSGATGIFPLQFNQTTLSFEERRNRAHNQAVAS